MNSFKKTDDRPLRFSEIGTFKNTVAPNKFREFQELYNGASKLRTKILLISKTHVHRHVLTLDTACLLTYKKCHVTEYNQITWQCTYPAYVGRYARRQRRCVEYTRNLIGRYLNYCLSKLPRPCTISQLQDTCVMTLALTKWTIISLAEWTLEHEILIRIAKVRQR